MVTLEGSLSQFEPIIPFKSGFKATRVVSEEIFSASLGASMGSASRFSPTTIPPTLHILPSLSSGISSTKEPSLLVVVEGSPASGTLSPSTSRKTVAPETAL